MRSLTIFLMFLVILAGTACKEVYKPDIISSPAAYLVVEGVLNAASGPTAIQLSRTFKLDDSASIQRERNAVVVVEGKDNTTRALTMTADGLYTSPDLGLVYNNEYRLRITTAGGKEYLSDYVVARKTPVIDSVGFRQDDKGVQVYVNTHDVSNDTRYYRWEYDETWEIHTFYSSSFKYVNGVVMDRTPADYVSVCWKYDEFSSILLGTTAKLQSDVVYRAPLLFIPNGDEKLAVRYSIMVRQYAMDKPGFEFFEMMKKNTEGLGTIFDPQPSEIRGNIHSTSDPEERVIGYVSAASLEQQRYFISRQQLRNWRFVEDCPEIPVLNNPDSIRIAYEGGGSIYNAIYSPRTGQVSFYLFSTLPCVECPARGGSLIRPTYW
ncbi:MAG: DUF4249 domain-containing protein [Chitinophagaceae bacterium]|nr:MAG: DUF4249 domain-containing protein [Chitinophagaceae bacterium]